MFVSMSMSFPIIKATGFRKEETSGFLVEGRTTWNAPRTAHVRELWAELEFLGATLSSAEPLSFDQKLLFTENMLKQCHCDYSVIYLPNEEPVDGRCPVGSCWLDILQ
jgi:hypothetical protein